MPSYKDKLPIQTTINFDTTPTNGSTNAVTSGGIYNSLILKQDNLTLSTTGTSGAATLVGSTLNIPQYQSVLTNPVTGTGTSGQVAYFNGTSSVTGSDRFLWNDSTNQLTLINESQSINLFLQKNNTPGVNDGYIIAFRRSDGTTAVPTNVTNNRGLGYLQFSGYHTGGYRVGGGLRSVVDGTVSSTSMPIRFEFLTTKDGETTTTIKAILKNNGNLLLQDGGTFTDNGQRLQVIGSTLLRGSGATSSTTALLVQNSTPTALLQVNDDGGTRINGLTSILGSNIANVGLAVYSNGSGGGSFIMQGLDSFSNLRFRLTATGNFRIDGATDIGTTGDDEKCRMNLVFSPTSGTRNHYAIYLTQAINQTGGANGITRGLYVNPTLTSAADWRSIETSNNTGYAAYFAGSADLFFNNATDLQFGTTTGTKIGTSTSQKIGLWNAAPDVQPTTAIAAAAFSAGTSGIIDDSATFGGYTIGQIVAAMKRVGLLA